MKNKQTVILKEVVLLLLLPGESVGLEVAPESGQTAAECPAVVLSPLAAEPLSLWLGGEDVQRVFRTVFVPKSELVGHGSEVKLLDVKSERSGSCFGKFASCDEASGGCGLWLR